MKEKEFMEFLNTLAKDVAEHFEGKKKRNTTFIRYYIVSPFHFIISIQYDYERNVYRLDLSASVTYLDISMLKFYGLRGESHIKKVSRYNAIESKYISSLFVGLPDIIFSVIRELNSCD